MLSKKSKVEDYARTLKLESHVGRKDFPCRRSQGCHVQAVVSRHLRTAADLSGKRHDGACGMDELEWAYISNTQS